DGDHGGPQGGPRGSHGADLRQHQTGKQDIRSERSDVYQQDDGGLTGAPEQLNETGYQGFNEHRSSCDAEYSEGRGIDLTHPGLKQRWSERDQPERGGGDHQKQPSRDGGKE